MPRLHPTKKSLPILSNLDDLRIASPCDASWDDMRPLTTSDGERARSCAACDKNVYDLSSMTRADALALIERHEGRCCVRFYRRVDGTVLTEDCPVGLRAILKKAERHALLTAAAGVSVVAAVVAVLVGASHRATCSVKAIETRLEDRLQSNDTIPVPPMPPMMGALPPLREPQQPAPPPRRPLMGKPATKAPPTMGRAVASPRVLMGDVALPSAAVEAVAGQ
jgi:hypothetical protein